MYGSKSTTSVLLLSILAVVVLSTGCSEDPVKPEPEPTENPRASRMGLIEFFAQAHEDQDLVAYEECLHEDYQFWFSEDDRSDPCWDWRNWIDKVEDVRITENMFEAENVTEIRVTFFNETSVDSAQSEEDKFLTGTTTIGDSTVTYYWGDFRLDMHVIVDTGDEQLDHFVDGRVYIYLLPDPDDELLWTIWKIEDRGNMHRKTEAATWSGLKVLYRK